MLNCTPACLAAIAAVLLMIGAFIQAFWSLMATWGAEATNEHLARSRLQDAKDALGATPSDDKKEVDKAEREVKVREGALASIKTSGRGNKIWTALGWLFVFLGAFIGLLAAMSSLASR